MAYPYSPFTYIPDDVCDGFPLPAFPVLQDCVSYSQLHSEVSGLVIFPFGAVKPFDWTSWTGWEANIDNEDDTKAHHVAGIGSFLPVEKSTVSLAGGRVVENRERGSRLSFSVLNMNHFHTVFARQCQRNKRDFVFWIRTASNRVIGGISGMRPIFTDADFLFNSGPDARESFTITIETEFLEFPQF